MQITLHIEGDSNEASMKSVLAALSGGTATVSAPPAEIKAAPAKAQLAKAAKPEPEKAPAEADVQGDDEEAKMELAVERATALINGGDADKLRGILGGIGVKRVSELEGAQLTQFLEETA